MSSQTKPQNTSIAHLVSHTHWDREWRYPIWTTRFMLVDFIDELLEVLEAGQYAGFLLDGQCSPIHDYLEIRPENRSRIEKLVRSGKLSIGPWYTLPDEYPVDGEAMVRNLLWGDRVSRQLGGVMQIGYTSFGWGQTAQLPQIYAGFGIDVAMIGKQVSEKRAPRCEFLWRAPDGTELLTSRFGRLGRQNFYFHVHLSALFNTDHNGPGWEYRWENGGLAYHRADDEQREQDGFRLDAPERWSPEFITPQVIEAVWNTMEDSVLSDDRLMMNGCDYTAAQPMFPQMVDRLNEVDRDRTWIQTTLPEYVQMMREKIDRAALPVVEGELRDGPVEKNTGNAMSTRLYLKRLNKQAQNLLIRFAEPMCVAASVAGAEYPEAYLRLAWENLLASHPHDSINGVTQDKTVLDVQNRLNQVIEIAQAAGDRAMQELIRRIDRPGFTDTDVLLVAFNPLPYPRREIARVWLDLPQPSIHPCDCPPENDPPCMFDADGQSMPTQYHGKRSQERCIAELHTRAFPFICDQHLLYFDPGEIPAGGYKVFRVGRRSQASGIPWSGPGQRTVSLRQAPEILENEYLCVTMNPNGTFDLTDKQRNRTYKGLNAYEDRGEHGTYWINRRPMYDQIHTSTGCSARIWCAEEGPLQATLVSEITMHIPKCGRREQDRRGDELEDMTIQTAVTLRAGSQ
ncbi:MAG: alpha-mannosidase, partial [Phycisphaerales bacterium]|nr:alpha-mannosidase [Phycisphaerales bacterium]